MPRVIFFARFVNGKTDTNRSEIEIIDKHGDKLPKSYGNRISIHLNTRFNASLHAAHIIHPSAVPQNRATPVKVFDLRFPIYPR